MKNYNPFYIYEYSTFSFWNTVLEECIQYSIWRQTLRISKKLIECQGCWLINPPPPFIFHYHFTLLSDFAAIVAPMSLLTLLIRTSKQKVLKQNIYFQWYIVYIDLKIACMLPHYIQNAIAISYHNCMQNSASI